MGKLESDDFAFNGPKQVAARFVAEAQGANAFSEFGYRQQPLNLIHAGMLPVHIADCLQLLATDRGD